MSRIERNPEALAAWFAGNIGGLSGRGLYWRGHEPGTQDGTAFHAAQVRVLLARLSSYRAVASGTTHLLLGEVAAQVPGVFLDRAFVPLAEDEKKLRRAEIPLWTSLNCKRSPLDFALVAITHGVVQELLNLPAMLLYSGIPLSREQREQENAPLVILGGSNAYVTAILHGEIGVASVLSPIPGSGLVDAVYVGDGSAGWRQILEIMREPGAIPRKERLRRLCERVEGLYDPARYRQVFSQQGQLIDIVAEPGAPASVRPRRENQELFQGGYIPFAEEGAASAHLLVSHGCPYFCSFCKESWEQKPYREAQVPALLAAARHIKQNRGVTELSLMTFNVSTVSYLPELLAHLEKLFSRVSLKSQRFDAIAHDPALVERQLEIGKRSFTCAMEGISERMRGLLNKNLSEKVLLAGFAELFRHDVRKMKVFLIVTGYENETDLAEFGTFLMCLEQLRRTARRQVQITFSLACLFRPPLTPWQFFPRQRDPEILNDWLTRIGAVVVRAKFLVRTSAGPWGALVSEYLAWADYRHTRILVEASCQHGFRYHGAISREVHDFWSARRAALSLNEAKTVATDGYGKETVFPWDIVDAGVSRDFLWRVAIAMREGMELRSCLPPPTGTGVCQGCAACRTPAERLRCTSLASHGQSFAVVGSREKTELTKWRCLLHIPEPWADTGIAFLSAVLGRTLMKGYDCADREATSSSPENLGYAGIIETFPRISSYGLWLAEFLWEKPSAPLLPPPFRLQELPNSSARPQLQILALERAVTPFPTGPLTLLLRWPTELAKPTELSGPAGLAQPAVWLDRVLTARRLKHHKQRGAAGMVWRLAPGHARATGVLSCTWCVEKNGFLIEAKTWPDSRILDDLLKIAPLEVLALASYTA